MVKACLVSRIIKRLIHNQKSQQDNIQALS